MASPEWLAQHLNDDDIVVVAVSRMGPADVKAYGKGHIPGALHWRWQEMLRDSAKRDFPTQVAFALRMAGQGISPDTTVVIYGEVILFGGDAWWDQFKDTETLCRMLQAGEHARARSWCIAACRTVPPSFTLH